MSLPPAHRMGPIRTLGRRVGFAVRLLLTTSAPGHRHPQRDQAAYRAELRDGIRRASRCERMDCCVHSGEYGYPGPAGSPNPAASGAQDSTLVVLCGRDADVPSSHVPHSNRSHCVGPLPRTRRHREPRQRGGPIPGCGHGQYLRRTERSPERLAEGQPVAEPDHRPGAALPSGSRALLEQPRLLRLGPHRRGELRADLYPAERYVQRHRQEPLRGSRQPLRRTRRRTRHDHPRPSVRHSAGHGRGSSARAVSWCAARSARSVGRSSTEWRRPRYWRA